MSIVCCEKTRFKMNPKPLNGIFSSFLNQVQTCLRDDAKVQACWKNASIKPKYCIIIFKQFWTCLKDDAIKTNHLYQCFQNKFFLFQKMMQSKQVIASLFSNSLEHVWLGLAGPGWLHQTSFFHNVPIMVTNKLLEPPRG